MSIRCAQCAWENYNNSKDAKLAIRNAGTAGGVVWNGVSLCETHFAKELLAMEQRVMMQLAKQELEQKEKTAQPEQLPQV